MVLGLGDRAGGGKEAALGRGMNESYVMDGYKDDVISSACLYYINSKRSSSRGGLAAQNKISDSWQQQVFAATPWALHADVFVL